MLKPYEVTVTYRLNALNEDDAITLALLKDVEPDEVDTRKLPVYQEPEIDIMGIIEF